MLTIPLFNLLAVARTVDRQMRCKVAIVELMFALTEWYHCMVYCILLTHHTVCFLCMLRCAKCSLYDTQNTHHMACQVTIEQCAKCPETPDSTVVLHYAACKIPSLRCPKFSVCCAQCPLYDMLSIKHKLYRC